MAKIAFIWDEHTEIESNLKQAAQGSEWEFITHQEAFGAIENWEAFKIIVLLAELKWTTNSIRTAFFGFKILTTLRIRKVKSPIVICSFLPKSFFLAKGDIPYGVLKSPAYHPFIQLPVAVDQAIADLPSHPMSANYLEDLILHFFDRRGNMDEIIHNLKDKIRDSPLKEVDYAFKAISSLLRSDQHEALDQLKIELLEQIELGKQNLIALIDILKAKLIQLLSVHTSPTIQTYSVRAWQVLFIDDNPKQRKRVAQKLRRRSIECIVASSSQEAFAILQADNIGTLKQPESHKVLPPNTITVVVCDLRLKENGEDWQALQGYDIIDNIYRNFSNFINFFVLTSKKGAILHHLKKIKGVQISWFAKEDVLDIHSENGFNLFTERIREEGDRIFEIVCSFPTAKYWNHNIWQGKINYPLQQFYRRHRLSSKFHQKEKWIAKCAMEFIEEAKIVKDPFFKKKTKVTSLSFPTTFKAGLISAPVEDSAMEKFFIKLIGRRIAIGLHLIGWEINEISSIMKFKELKRDIHDRQLFNSYLALSSDLEKDIPNNLLLEEKTWIEIDLGIALGSQDKILFEAIETLLIKFQKILRFKGCSEDFVDDAIKIGTRDQAIEQMRICQLLSVEYHCREELTMAFQELFSNSKYRNSVRRNQFSNLLAN